MIQDIEEESKTKFSMDVEFSFSFKAAGEETACILRAVSFCVMMLFSRITADRRDRLCVQKTRGSL